MTNCARLFLVALAMTLIMSPHLQGEEFGRLPLRFEVNQGQADPRVRFLSRGRGLRLFLAGDETVLAPDGRPDAAFRLRLAGASAAPEISGLDRLPGESHYLIGNDTRAWRTHVPAYARVRYREVYPGIDLVFHGDQDVLEFDFEVAPGADPGVIRMAFKGMDRLRLDPAGNLVIETAAGEIVQRAPVLYQDVDGRRRPVEGRYALKRRGRVGFEVGEYDRGRPLVIDPALIYSTYLGGSGSDYAKGIAVDSTGSAYVTGQTNSTNFPLSNARQPGYGGGTNDVFIVKLDPAGTSLVYSTYLGGSSLDRGMAIEVDAGGSVLVTGATYSPDFPVAGTLQPYRNGDAFVARLTPDGSGLVYSTFLGGTGNNEEGRDIVLDGQGNAYVAGMTNSTDFPRVAPFQSVYGGGNSDAFVARLNAAGTALGYSTYLGGAADDVANGVAVDSQGNAYVTGRTSSSNFPIANAFRPAFGGAQDAFLAKLGPAGSPLAYSTYLGGGSFDSGNGIAVDAAGSACVVGETLSDNFPVASPIDPIRGSDNEGFVARFNATGSGLLFSTFLGGTGVDRAQGVVLDGSGHILVTGDTAASDFPVVNPVQAAQAGGGDIFVTILDPAGSAFLFSTYLGGSSAESCCADIAVGGSGDAYVAGDTASFNFPTVNPVQGGSGGAPDAFIARMSVGPPSPLAPLVLRVEEDRLEWTPVANATGYDIVRGDLGTLLRTGGDFTAATAECLADDYAPTVLPYAEVPARGQAFWFLARWVTPAQVGSFDSGGPGQVGLRDAEIDASPLACPAALRPHAPIVIDGDGGFTVANGVIRGSGTPADPYIIAFWDIAGPPGGAGILIGITNAHFVIRNVSVHGGEYGIRLNFVRNGRIERIRATGNTHGIRIFSGGDIEIEGNVSSSNTQGSGIDVLGASNVLVRGNTLAGNMVGINLDGAAAVLVHHNNVLSNVLQAIDQRGGSNAWDDGYPVGGNYWTNYQGIDQCSGPAQDQCAGPDGFGDTPYVIGPGNNLDRYPLMILPGSGSDTVPPTVAITSPPNGAVFTMVPIVVQGAAADTGSGVRRAEVRVNGGPWTMAAGISPWSLSVGLVPGGNLIEARSFDHAGNVSAVKSISVTYQSPLETEIMTDKTAYAPGEPVAITLLLTNRGASPVTLNFFTSCEAFFSVLNLAGAVVYDLRLHQFCLQALHQRTVQPGETVTYNFGWNQVDDAGQPVPAPADYRIRGFLDSQEPVPDAFTSISVAQPDTVPPTVAITSPPSGAVFTTVPITVQGVAADAESGLARVEVRVNGAPWLVASGTSSWSLSVGLSPGDNLIEARSWDQAGNVSAVASISVTYQAPALVTVILTDKATYAPGELVLITLRLTNQGISPVTLNFSSTCEAFFSVLDVSGAVVYDDRAHVICLFVITQRTVQPGETVTYNFEWNQANDSGQQVPAPADYRIRGFLDSGEFVPDAFTTISVGP